MTTRSQIPQASVLSPLRALGGVLLFILFSGAAVAQSPERDYTLRWLHQDTSNVAGYDVYLSLDPNADWIGIDIGIVDPDDDGVRYHTLEGLDSQFDYYVTMTAYNQEMQRSDFSNQILVVKQGTCAADGCDDDNPCTEDVCADSSCSNEPLPDGELCDDGETSTVGDSCNAGTCSGILPECSFDSDCIDDLDVCNGTPVCIGHLCTVGIALECPASTECSMRYCAPMRGCQSINAKDGVACSNGICEAGSCVSDGVPEEPPVEDDPNKPTYGVTAISGVTSGQVVSGSLRIEALVSSGTSSVRFLLDGVTHRTENYAPYSFNGDKSGTLTPWNSSTVPNGLHTITAIGFPQDKAGGKAGTRVSVTFEVRNEEVPANSTEDSGQTYGVSAITGVTNGQLVSGSLRIQALVSSGTSSVRFLLDGVKHRTENHAPYSFNGDSHGNLTPWHSSTVSNGLHTITAIGFPRDNETGEAGTRVSVTFEVRN